MAFTLSNLLVEAYKELGRIQFGRATGGSTTTLIDTNLTGFSDDDFNDGAVFVIHDSAGASAAPEGEFAVVNDYVNSTQTLTLRDTLTAAIASGDRYGISDSLYPLNEMIELANSALMQLGDVPQVDTATLDAATDQTEFTAALTWKRRAPYRVDTATLDNASDNQWRTLSNWEYVPAVAGTTGLIVFDGYPPYDNDLRVWYKDRHAYVSAFDDAIYEGFEPELATQALVTKALDWLNTRLQGGDDFLLQRSQKADVEYETRMRGHTPWAPKKKAKLLIIGDQLSRYPGDRNPV